jgi:hypothetical protein
MSERQGELPDGAEILLEEIWQDMRGQRYRLVVSKPLPFMAEDFQCFFYVEGLYTHAKCHPQVSAALAIKDAIHVATSDLLAIRAHPFRPSKTTTEP